MERSDRDSNLRPLCCRSDTVTTTWPTCHHATRGSLAIKPVCVRDICCLCGSLDLLSVMFRCCRQLLIVSPTLRLTSWMLCNQKTSPRTATRTLFHVCTPRTHTHTHRVLLIKSTSFFFNFLLLSHGVAIMFGRYWRIYKKIGGKVVQMSGSK